MRFDEPAACHSAAAKWQVIELGREFAFDLLFFYRGFSKDWMAKHGPGPGRSF